MLMYELCQSASVCENLEVTLIYGGKMSKKLELVSAPVGLLQLGP